VCEQPAQPWSLADMARVAHVTPRHLARLFSSHVGSTPRAYVESVRHALAARAVQSGQPAKQALAGAGIAGDRQWRRMRQRAATPANRKPAGR
jgi:AraC-like DNA-binding protein